MRSCFSNESVPEVVVVRDETVALWRGALGDPAKLEASRVEAWVRSELLHQPRPRYAGRIHVLVVLFGSLFVYRVLGLAGVSWFVTWLECARAALATMFLFTAISHFAPMKADLIAMVPRALPRPDLLVFATGIAEIAGAIGLLIPGTRLWAAVGLMTLLVAMLPANVNAARQGLRLRGRRATPLLLRVPMQALFIVWTWIVR